MINKLYNISLLFFREMIRSRIFVSFVLLGVLLVFISLLINRMVVGQEIKVTKDLGLSILNVFSFLIIFVGINRISGDLNQRPKYFLFSKPVKRWEYLLGSSISVLSITMYIILILCLTIFVVSFIQNDVWISGILFAGLLTFFEMLILISFATLFSVFLSAELAMLFTLFIYVAGHSAEKLLILFERLPDAGLRYSLIMINGLFPNLVFFNRKTEIVYSINLPFSYFFAVSVYSIAYASLIFLISVFIFNRKKL